MLKNDVFAEGMAGMCEVFRHEMSKAVLTIYYRALEGLTGDQFKSACAHIVSTRKYTNFPMPAEFLEHVHGNPEDKALMELHVVEKAMRDHGAYSSVIFSDPVTMAVISRWEGGWPGICGIQDHEWRFARKDFVRLWGAYSTRVLPKAPAHLIGITEGNNAVSGYPDEIPKPILIAGEGVVALVSGEPISLPEADHGQD